MIYAFDNVEEFKELFGTKETASGEIVRKNKILLGFLKDRRCHNWLRDNEPRRAKKFFRTDNVSDATLGIIMTAGDAFVGFKSEPQPLSKYTPRQLMEELASRGYTGQLRYVQTIDLGRL